MTLETTNPHCSTCQTEELLIELLGGVRVDGLDRMRVTIKVTVVNRKHAGYLSNPELAGLSIRHNLDLYNDTQVEKFVRRVAEKLETGSIALTKAIADITSQLEQYRLQQLDRQETRKEKILSKVRLLIMRIKCGSSIICHCELMTMGILRYLKIKL